MHGLKMKIFDDTNDLKIVLVPQTNVFAYGILQTHYFNAGFVEKYFRSIGNIAVLESTTFKNVNPHCFQCTVVGRHILEQDTVFRILALPLKSTGVVVLTKQAVTDTGGALYTGNSSQLSKKCFQCKECRQ